MLFAQCYVVYSLRVVVGNTYDFTFGGGFDLVGHQRIGRAGRADWLALIDLIAFLW